MDTKPTEIIPTRENWLSRQSAWIANRDELTAAAAKITEVEDQETFDNSAKIQTQLSKAKKELNNERMKITRQIDAVKKEFMEQETKLSAPIEAELARIKKLNDAFNTHREMARQAELRRIAEEQRKRDEDAAAAQMEAEELFGSEVRVDDPTDTFTPAPEKVRSESARVVKRWNFELRDLSKVPPEYLDIRLNEKAVRAYISMCNATQKEPSVPGLNFSFYMSTESK